MEALELLVVVLIIIAFTHLVTLIAVGSVLTRIERELRDRQTERD